MPVLLVDLAAERVDRLFPSLVWRPVLEEVLQAPQPTPDAKRFTPSCVRSASASRLLSTRADEELASTGA